jgi:hypothetical protein
MAHPPDFFLFPTPTFLFTGDAARVIARGVGEFVPGADADKVARAAVAGAAGAIQDAVATTSRANLIATTAEAGSPRAAGDSGPLGVQGSAAPGTPRNWERGAPVVAADARAGGAPTRDGTGTGGGTGGGGVDG